MKKRTILIFLVSMVMLLCPAVIFADNGTSVQTENQPEQSETQVQKGWNSNRTVYYDENGKKMVGLFVAPGKNNAINALYYADSSGNVKKGPIIVTINANQKRYIYDADSGYKEVSATDKNAYTYFISDTDGDYKIVSKAGLYSTGKSSYIVLDNGTVRKTEGFADIGGKRYYVQKSGAVKTNSGWITYKNKKYRAGSKGVIRTKAGSFAVAGNRYLITKKNGPIRTTPGVVRANGKLYYVKNSKGVLGSNKAYTIGKKVYHVNKNGVVQVGKHKWKNKYYYSVLKGYLKQTEGMVVKAGKRFYVKKGGLVLVNQKFKYKKWFYIADKTGTIKTGLFKWKGVLYYANEKGSLKRSSGIVKVGQYSYYVAAGGRVYVNQKFWAKDGKLYVASNDGHLKKGLFKWKGYSYFAGSDYSVYVNKQFEDKGYTYIADADGHLLSGFFKWGGYTHYADEKYHIYVDEKFDVSGKSYIADKYGRLKTGFVEWKGYDYYACANYYLYKNKKFWVKNKLYIADSDGHLKSGFFQWGKYHYYADSNHSVFVSKKFKVGNKIFMSGTGGYLRTGVFRWGGKYYYSDSDFVLDTKEELINYNNKKYYNKSGGGLAMSEWINYNGKHYYAGKKAAFLTTTFKCKDANGNTVRVTPASDGTISDADYKKIFEPQAEVIEDGSKS